MKHNMLNHLTVISLFIVWTLFFGMNVLAQTKTASMKVYSTSFQVSPITADLGDLGLSIDYFTTYDGNSSIFPLVEDDGSITSEFKAVPLGTTTFKADSMSYSTLLERYYMYGSVEFVIPSTDSDKNGISDFLQYDKAVNYTTKVTHKNNSPNTNTSVSTWKFVRQKNQLVGTVERNDGSQISRADWNVNYAIGELTYNPSDKTVTINGKLKTALGEQSYVGNSRYQRIDNNNVHINPMTFTAGTERFKLREKLILKRNGKRYIAKAAMEDGELDTSWRDMADWVFVIEDSNDTDKDGIPDLSDSLSKPPSITSQPESKEAKIGESVMFSVRASGTLPLSYQWRKNGSNIPGATQSSYSISNLRQSHFADYSVVVSSAAGSVTSNNAFLTQIVELIPVSIVQQPASAVAAIGENVSFKVSAIGSGTLRYQWKKDGQNINGATLDQYSVNNINESHFGSYSVYVYNNNSSAISDTIALTKEEVNAPPNFLGQPKSQELAQGEKVVLSAMVEGSSPIFYQWVKDEQDIPGAILNTYTINNFQARHVGNYYLIARNSAGESVSSTAIIKALGESMFELTSIKRFRQKSFKIDYQVPAGMSYAIESSANLKHWKSIYDSISNGKPTYLIDNPEVKSKNRFYRLQIKKDPTEPPIVTKKLFDQSIDEGDSTILSFNYNSEIESNVKWYKNDKILSGVTGKTLIISDAVQTDSGIYKAIISNAGGEISTQCILTINKVEATPPAIISQPEDLELYKSQTATFSVIANGSKPLTYQWYKYQKVLFIFSWVPVKGATGSSLSIMNAKSTNTGIYKVKVSNKYGSVFSQEVSLIIKG